MKTGTKSLLFGVHQFLWHPLTVYIAWVWLYRKLPTFKETICIIIHDWGYWGKTNMDGTEGETHPELGARLANKFLDNGMPGMPYLRTIIYRDLCLYHSRHYARNDKREPSKLCWADKLSILFEPWWLYLPRAWASGELAEYRITASKYVILSCDHRIWHKWVRRRLIKLGIEKRGDAVPYTNPEK